MGFIFNRKKKVSKDGTKINFLWAIPMYKEEIEFKLEEGFDAMMDLFSEKNFPLTIFSIL